MSARTLLSAAVLGGLACAERPSGQAPHRDLEDRARVPADSLVATAPGGAEVWLTLSRADSGPSGRCIARTIEIRQGGMRTPVPLLYTASAPALVNDTTLRATLSDRCQPGDRYLVDLRTGHPVRER